MGKQWCASLEHGRKRENNMNFRLAIVLLGLSTLGISVPAQTAPLQKDNVTSNSSDLQLPSFDVEVARDSEQRPTIQVGDVLKFHVIGFGTSGLVNHVQEVTIELPPDLKDLEEQGWEIQPLNLAKEKLQSEYFVSGIPLKPGKLIFPSLVLKNSQGKGVARTNPISLEVASAISPNDPKPQEPEGLEVPATLVFPWWIIAMAGVIAILLVIALGYLIYRQIKKNRKHIKKPETLRPEDEVALDDLAEVERQGYLKRGEFKIYYFRVSEILKFYMGARYRFDALESTTFEMISFLKEKQILSKSVLDTIEALFSQLDRVKFTDHIPEEAEAIRLLQEAKSLVQTTRKTPIHVGANHSPSNGVSNHAT